MVIDSIYPLLLILVPIVFGFITPLIGRLSKKGRDWLSVIGGLIPLIMILNVIPTVLSGENPAFTSFGMELLIDRLALFMLICITMLGFLSALYSMKYMAEEAHLSRYHACLHFFIAGMIGVVISQNLLLIYAFVEVMIIASCMLIAQRSSKRSVEASYKYFILCTIASFFILLGVILTYHLFNTVNLNWIRVISLDGTDRSMIALCIIFGFGVMAGMVPMHAWVPDASGEAPSSISCLLLGAMIPIALYTMVRVLYSLFEPASFGEVNLLMMYMGIISMIIGAMMALVQKDIKRLLAYSGINQVGFILLGLGTGTTIGFIGGFYHMLTYGVGIALLFFCAGNIIMSTKTRNFRELGGLSAKMPVTVIGFIIGALSLSGIPPFGGYLSKHIICDAAFSANQPLFAVISVITSVITLAYFLRVIQHAFLGKETANTMNVKESSLAMLIPIIFLSGICIILGIFANQILVFLESGLGALGGI
jgi:multicomponent Na+:H+ antiporter subunit D